MVARRILFLDAAGLTASLWRSGRIEAEDEFAPDTPGIEAFDAYLRARRGSLYHLLAEVADEGFHPEDIPAVRGRDRIALIKRKLAQYYYGTPLTVALAQGRLKEGRRDERMVFAALTRPQQFEPWLDALRRAEAALAGVFSVPQAIAALAAPLGHAHRRFLLITLSRGGLRQTFFDAGRLRFSRLTLLPSGTVAEASRACATETAKIHRYLIGHRLLVDDTPLPVLVLAHPSEAAAFRAHNPDSPELRFEYPDLAAAAAHCGLKTPLPGSRADALFAHLLLRATPRAQFAHADSRRYFHLRQFRFAVNGAGLALLAACLLFAGKQLFDSRRLDESTARMRIQNEEYRRKYQATLDALPPLPLPADQLRAVVGRYEDLLKVSPGPEPSLLRLSHALNRVAAVELDRLDWAVIAHGDDAATARRSGKPAPARPADAASAYAIVDLHGRLPPAMAGDRRGQLGIIDGLADQLRADAAVQVHILSRPFDVAPGKALKSGDGAGAAAAPKFTLRLAQQL